MIMSEKSKRYMELCEERSRVWQYFWRASDMGSRADELKYERELSELNAKIQKEKDAKDE